METNNFINTYLKETAEIANSLNQGAIEKMVEILSEIRKNKGNKNA